MDQDDTFRILKRPTFKELLRIFNNLSHVEKSGVFISLDTRDNWLRKHGWTLHEYRIAQREKDNNEKMGR